MVFVIAGAVITGAALLILAEYGLRFYLSRWTRPCLFFPNSRSEITLHPDAAPFLTRRTIRYEINNEGERGGRVPQGRKLYRLLAFGGSATECRLLDQSEALGAHLQRVLSQPTNLKALSAEAVHVGVVARSQLDSRGLRDVAQAILPYYGKLDLITVMVGMADLNRWFDAGAPSGAVPPAYPVHKILETSRGARYDWKNNALIRYGLRRVVTRFRVHRQNNAARSLVREAVARRSVTSWHTLDSDFSTVLEVYEQALTELIPVLKAKADRVIVIRPPWLEASEFTPEEAKSIWCGRIGKPGTVPARFIHYRDVQSYCEELADVTVRVARAQSVEVLDPRPFLSCRLGGSFYDHLHFTADGAAAMAEAITAAVLSPQQQPFENAAC